MIAHEIAVIAREPFMRTRPVPDLEKIVYRHPVPEGPLTPRLDAKLLRWFRRGRGYQTRINAILRAYMQAHEAGVAFKIPTSRKGREKWGTRHESV
jgi:uncharacterized protein (DUF4415 family)